MTSSSRVPASALAIELQRPDGSWLQVGLLRHDSEITWFSSEPAYWTAARRPVLGQVFEENDKAWQPSSRLALPNWFSHLLPEGRLRALVAAAAGVHARREFFLLERLGIDDLPGAVRATAVDDAADGGVVPEPQQHDPGDDDEAILKFSLAGVQLKFSLRHDGLRGLTVPTRGQVGDWIVKLPDERPGFDAVPEAELGCLELARAAGIPTPDAQLVDVAAIAALPDWARQSKDSAFAVRRFDRKANGTRVHAEQFAQILNIPTGLDSYKYKRANFETVAVVTRALCGEAAVADLIDRLVLNVLVGNGDAHLKNWVVIYPDGQRPQLSPVFDVVPTVLYIKDDNLGLKLGKSREFADIDARSFERLAVRCGWSVGEARGRAHQAVERIRTSWPLLRDYLSHERFDRLSLRLDRLPLAKV